MAAASLAAAAMTTPACRIECEALVGRAMAPSHAPLSFSVAPGRIVFLSGKSGSGKSSLLLSMLGLNAPHQGSIARSVGNATVGTSESALCTWRAQHVGIVPQGAGLVAALSAEDHLNLLGLPKQARDSLLGQFGMLHRRHARADALSGGELRRLCVMQALSKQASIHLWDEPTAGLDDELADVVWRALADAARNGAAVLVASHDARGLAMLTGDPHVQCESLPVATDLRP